MRPSQLSSILREQRDFKSRILQATTQFQHLLVEFRKKIYSGISYWLNFARKYSGTSDNRPSE